MYLNFERITTVEILILKIIYREGEWQRVLR